jgi:uncharacterized OB-fold protein
MAIYRGLDLSVAPTDSEHRGFFEAAGRGDLVVQRCSECARLRSWFGAACPFCGDREWSWQPTSGLGTIFSYQIVVHPVQPPFRDWVPYPLVLVELDEQRGVEWRDGAEGERVSLRLTTNLVDRNDPTLPERQEAVEIGARVKACFVDLGHGLALPQFQLTDEGR